MSAEYYLLEILPLLLMGILCGFVKFVRGENELLNDEKMSERTRLKYQKLRKTRFLRGFDVVLTSAITSLIIFACLSYFSELTYMVKIAISSSVALYGVDKILEILQKIISLKKGS